MLFVFSPFLKTEKTFKTLQKKKKKGACVVKGLLQQNLQG